MINHLTERHKINLEHTNLLIFEQAFYPIKITYYLFLIGTMSQSNNSSHNFNSIPAATFADCLANSKEIFELIDTVFPVDSCRHYEVLPLSLKENNLALGIIDPNNEESLKFVNSIAKVFRYKLSLKLIDNQTLQIILASYPHNSQQPAKNNQSKDKNKTVIDATVIEDVFDSEPVSRLNNASQTRIADSAPTVISQSDQQEVVSGLAGLPPDLDFLKDLDLSAPETSQSSKAEIDQAGTLYEIPPEFLHQQHTDNLDHKQTVIAEDPHQLLNPSQVQDEADLALVEAQISDLIAEVSDQIKAQEKPASSDFLIQLNPQLSWQDLLEESFKYNSEEINLTRYEDYGNITTYQDNSLQSALNQVPLPIFCSLIDEIKRMAKIPLDLSNHPKKVVLERFYQEERILLRLEFTLKDEQELVIVQIFRDKNLEIYEQKQMDKMSEQALYLARQLEKTLRRIQACFDSAEFSNLRELQTVQSRINHQLRLLDK